MTIPTKIWRTAKAMAALPIVAWKTFTSRTLHLSEWWRGLTGAAWSAPTYEVLSKKAHANPYAARALRLISQSMASVPIMAKVGEGDAAEFKEDHELARLLARPNRRQTRRQFVDAIVNHLYCGGELFIERRGPATGQNAGKARELHLERPDRFVRFIRMGQAPAGFLERLSAETRRLARTGEIIGYEFNAPGGEPRTYTVDDMLHVRVYNPADEDRGLPILVGAHRALETMEASDDWNRSIAKGAGRVPMYWVPEGLERGQQLTTEQVQSAEESLDARTKERRKANLGMVLSGSFKPVDGNVSPKDADWLGASNENARRVAAVTGVSMRLLADDKTGSLTDAGVNSEVRALMLLTVLPLLDFVLEELNAWLSEGMGAELVYDRDQIEALQEDMTEMYRRYTQAVAGGIISVNEAREALRWDARGPAFDELLRPMGLQPVREGGGEGEEPELLRALRSAGDDDAERMLKLVAA